MHHFFTRHSSVLLMKLLPLGLIQEFNNPLISKRTRSKWTGSDRTACVPMRSIVRTPMDCAVARPVCLLVQTTDSRLGCVCLGICMFLPASIHVLHGTGTRGRHVPHSAPQVSAWQGKWLVPAVHIIRRVDLDDIHTFCSIGRGR
jgi:hypothetical protein